MKISIVVPSRNYARYIRRAIDSVLNQSYPDKELIVIDGHSTDDTLEILKSYGSSIKWISEPDRGQWEAINKGLKVATGDVFAYLNADDWYVDGIFESVVKIFKGNPSVNLVYGDCQIINGESKKIFSPPEKIGLGVLLNRGNLTPQPATFFRKSVLDKAGGTGEYHYMMEYDLNLKALKSGEAFYLSRVLANFSVHPDQKSDVRNRELIMEEMLKISRNHGGHLFSRLSFSYKKNFYLKNLLKQAKRLYWLRIVKSWFDLILWLLSNKKDRPAPVVIKRSVIKRHAKRFLTPVFIETGTYFGDTVMAVKSSFDKIHSIELGQELAVSAKKRFSQYPNIQIHQGDSAKILSQILTGISRPATFWLDAHCSEGITCGDDEYLPLVKELEVIFKHWQPGSVILIDDARHMGRQKGYPSFKEILKIVQDSNLDLGIKQELDIIRIH